MQNTVIFQLYKIQNNTVINLILDRADENSFV